MCQMCDEYESELVRMGLIEDAKAFREEREREHGKAVAEVAGRAEPLSCEDGISISDIAPKVHAHQ